MALKKLDHDEALDDATFGMDDVADPAQTGIFKPGQLEEAQDLTSPSGGTPDDLDATGDFIAAFTEGIETASMEPVDPDAVAEQDSPEAETLPSDKQAAEEPAADDGTLEAEVDTIMASVLGIEPTKEDDAAEEPQDEESASDDAAEDAADSADDTTDSADESEAEAAAEAGAEAEELADENASEATEPEAAAAPAEVQPMKKRRALKALLVSALTVLVIAGGCCVALAVDDSHRTKQVPENTTLDGEVDISGMTADELEQVIQERSEDGISPVVNLEVEGKDHSFKLSDIGDIDLSATVDEAFAPYDVSMVERWGNRIETLVTDEDPSYSVTTVCLPDEKRLTDYISSLAKQLDRKAAEPGYEYDEDKGKLKSHKGKDGIKIDVNGTVKAIQDAVKASDDVEIPVACVAETLKPKATEPGQAIFIDTYGCRLYFYEGGKVTTDYACSPGQAGYSTPQGDWYLEYKDPSPVWINPHSEWSKKMPETIAPGYSNPLGLRALAVSCGGGIYIHGTTNIGALGYPDSHGCIRLSNDNICDLYDRVDEGIPIIIR